MSSRLRIILEEKSSSRVGDEVPEAAAQRQSPSEVPGKAECSWLLSEAGVLAFVLWLCSQ